MWRREKIKKLVLEYLLFHEGQYVTTTTFSWSSIDYISVLVRLIDGSVLWTAEIDHNVKQTCNE